MSPKPAHLSFLLGRRTAFAVAAFAVATALTLLLWDAVFYRVPFALYFAAVALAAWQAGWRAGIALAAAGVLAVLAHQRFPADLSVPSLVLLGVSTVVCLIAAARDRAIESLRESERQYSLMVENVRDYAMFMTDLSGRVTKWNTGAERVLGWQEEEIVGRPAAVIFTPEDRETGIDAGEMEKAARDGHAVDERWHVRKDGSRFFATGMLMRVNDGQGQHVGFTKVLRDVTDRRRADEARRMVEFRWQRLVEQSPLSIQVFAPDGAVRQVNRAWERLWGITLADVPGYNILKDPQLAASGMMPRFERAFAGEAVTIEPVPYVLDRGEHAGRPRWVGAYVYPVKNHAGEVEEVVLVHEDVTERRQAEAALRESEGRLRQMADAMPQMVWVTRPDGHHEFFNRRWYEFTGVPEGSTDGDGWNGMFHPEDQDRAWAAWRHSLATGEPYEVEYRLRHHTGEYHWTLGRALPVRDGGGAIERWVGTCTDIDALKTLEAERESLLRRERSSRESAERSSQMKDEFLATLSHELRTPLSAILGWSLLLRRDGHITPEKLAQGLTTIERNARAQTQIIEDLLDMSRIISGKIAIDARRINLSSVVQAAIETVRAAATAKGIEIVFAPPTDARQPIFGDVNRLQQVFWNLLSNSIKFTPRGGTVDVRIEQRHSQWQVDVTDTGDGIDADFLPHVFDRFRQADASTTRKHGGLGLGLAIVKQLVELHGGTVRVRSEGLGKGSTFTVSLPVRVIHETPDAGHDRPQSGQLTPGDAAPTSSREGASWDPTLCEAIRGMTVVVVDDEPDARALVTQLLSECGVKVHATATAVEAIEAIRSCRPDVLVSDIGMPEVDGYQLLKRVRELSADEGGTTPAIALTAYARAEDRMKAIRAGFQMHVPKPVEPAELLTMIATLRRPETR